MAPLATMSSISGRAGSVHESVALTWLASMLSLVWVGATAYVSYKRELRCQLQRQRQLQLSPPPPPSSYNEPVWMLVLFAFCAVIVTLAFVRTVYALS